jgi:hypothetical protein
MRNNPEDRPIPWRCQSSSKTTIRRDEASPDPEAPVPPFTEETARVQAAKDAWNARDLSRCTRVHRSYTTARAVFPGQAAHLERVSAAENADQGRRARQIVQADDSYLRDYSMPLMDTERKNNPAAAWSRAVGGEGLERLVPLRAQFAGFEDAQRKIAAAGEQHSIGAAREAPLMFVVAGLFAMHGLQATASPMDMRPEAIAVAMSGMNHSALMRSTAIRSSGRRTTPPTTGTRAAKCAWPCWSWPRC